MAAVIGAAGDFLKVACFTLKLYLVSMEEVLGLEVAKTHHLNRVLVTILVEVRQML